MFPNDSAPIDPEAFWEAILSRDPQQIQAAFARLDREAQKAVMQHLFRMVNEPGWHPEQRLSARKALEALGIPPNYLRQTQTGNVT
ncbi:hypothetical protein [uncultured Thermanaerothrix sp.]|uniref:hypothetical protein n=1 Tax=uncultured Thermanaerothrix sp. TaxID=1195149 RepID=UPI002626262B|nr:hypothetical protein [uncultured Thermanaerothrix sp.]